VGHLFVLSALLNSVPFTLFAYGETHISAVLAGLINAFTPLATVIVAVFILRQEPYSSTVIGGLVVGLIGVVVVIGAWNGFGKSQLLGIGACLVAVICYGFGFSYARGHLGRLPDKPVALATGQVLCGTLQLLPFSSCSATSRHIARCRRSWPWVPSVSSAPASPTYLTSTLFATLRNHRQQRHVPHAHLRRRRRRRVSRRIVELERAGGRVAHPRRCRARPGSPPPPTARKRRRPNPGSRLKQGCRDSHMARMTMTFKFHRDAESWATPATSWVLSNI